MRHLTCTAVALLASIAAAEPWSKPLSAAADAVEDAYDRTQRSNGRCRNQIGPSLDGLVDRIDALKKQQSPVNELNQLRFELATLGQQAPFAACPIGVTEDIQRGLDAMEDARISMWNDPGRRNGGSRRDQRKGDQGGMQSQFVQLSPIKVTPNVPFQGEGAVQLSLPEVRFEFMQGQGFYIATRFRSFEGDWSEWVTTQVWTVPSSPFVWKNAYNHVLRYSTLAEDDFSNGRFIAHVAVFNGQGQELAFREVTFKVNLTPQVVVPPPPPVVLRRDCGTGPNDPGCLMVRDGRFAMDAATYQGFLSAMRANRSEMMRGSMASSMLEQNSLTAAQLEPMLDLFNSEMMKLDFAMRAAPKLVNPQHAIGFSSKFRSSMNQTAYTQTMAQQQPGVQYQPGMVGPGGVAIQFPGPQPGVVVQPGVVMAPGVVVQQPGQPQPAVMVQVPGMTVQVTDPNMMPPPPPPRPGMPPPPVYVQPAVAQVRDCGTGPNDPGCGLARNGFVSMDATVFNGMMTSLRNVMNEIVREDMFKNLIARNGRTAMQLSQVLDLFRNEITRLDIAKEAASHVVNPQHALGLSTKFSNSFSAEEFVEVYSGQH
ncbi:MAG: hypothetical protein GQE15_03185 [Archangiaceae bacterium]|nr:hypothetical protein [Archangiaceae bacterium]